MHLVAQLTLWTAQAILALVALLTVHAMVISAGKPPCSDISSTAALNACYRS